MKTRNAPLIALGIAAALVGLAMACGGGGAASPTATQRAATPTTQAAATPTTQPVGGNVVSIELTENPYRFIPDSFDFKVGQTYTLSFNMPLEFHTFTVDELGIDITIDAGQKVTMQITPDKAGTFRLVCIPHEALGMVGEVRVTQ